jgi:hypothetical protein
MSLIHLTVLQDDQEGQGLYQGDGTNWGRDQCEE